MSIPFRFDDSTTERSGALALAAIGIGQKEIDARTVAARGDASVGLVGIGSAGSASQNPMAIDGPLPSFQQPNPPASPTSAAPPVNVNAMKLGPVTAGNYQQPNVITPAARAGTTPSRLNPMGL